MTTTPFGNERDDNHPSYSALFRFEVTEYGHEDGPSRLFLVPARVRFHQRDLKLLVVYPGQSKLL